MKLPSIWEATIKLSDEQEKVLASEGPLLVTGGPGSGKTTVSILKAGLLVEQHLQPFQRVLFLSFARATVARVLEAISETNSLLPESRKLIEVDTYHALFWRIVCTHGYLVGLPRAITLLTPQAEAVELSEIRHQFGADRKLNTANLALKRAAEVELRDQLAKDKGLVCFDLFAPTVAQIFERSQKIRAWFATRYPIIIVDEFQDTDPDQWRVIQALRNECLVIALADSEQRIFDFIGADPERLNHFKAAFAPTVIDLKKSNHRSAGTEIALFANDLLAGRFSKSSYDGIAVEQFPCNKNQAYSSLISTVLQARKRMLASGNPGWSIAVLAPTKRMTRTICDVFAQTFGKLPAIPHSAAVDVSGIMLAAEVVAFALEPMSFGREKAFIDLLVAFYRGKSGDRPTGGDLKTADALKAGFEKYESAIAAGKATAKSSMAAKAVAVLHEVDRMERTGDVRKDWIGVRDIFRSGDCKQLHPVAEEVRNLRLLTRGADLRDVLVDIWRANVSYVGALEAVRDAFVQDHFASAAKPETGVIVMNMHKSKGKQFDEVVIFEGWPSYVKGEIKANPDRIAWGNDPDSDNQQARQIMRVAITRAKSKTTILTPDADPCILLLG